MRSPVRLSLLLVGSLTTHVVACGDDAAVDTETTSATSDAASSSSDGSEMCTPGHESCTCVDGDLCLAGLTCVSDVCVDLGDVTTGTTGDSSSSTSSSTGKDTESSSSSTTGDPPDACVASSECASDEVCVGGVCGSTDWYYFNVYVERFDPPSCEDGFGTAELYYDYYHNDVYVSTSATDMCPGEWPLEALYYDSLQSFRVAFWEADAFEDDFIVSLCWGGDPCEPIPPEILHDGAWSGTDSSGDYYMEFTFIPIEDDYGY